MCLGSLLLYYLMAQNFLRKERRREGEGEREGEEEGEGREREERRKEKTQKEKFYLHAYISHCIIVAIIYRSKYLT